MALEEGTPTRDLQVVRADLALQVDAAPPLGVIGSTEAGHVHHALIVHVHVAGWRQESTEHKAGETESLSRSVYFPNDGISCLRFPENCISHLHSGTYFILHVWHNIKGLFFFFPEQRVTDNRADPDSAK